MGKAPKALRTKYRKDPLVPISGKHVAAGIKQRGYSVNEAARRMGERQQTLDAIVQGRTERCRASRRRRFSRLLKLPESWLEGSDTPPIPGLSPWETIPVVGEGVPSWWRSDENFLRYPEGDLVESLPSYQLEWGYLAERIVNAWKRDIEIGARDAENALRAFRPGEPDEEHWRWVITCVQRSLSLVRWRGLLLATVPMPEAPPDLDDMDPDAVWELATNNARRRPIPPSREAMDAFAESGARAVEEILGPWLDGDRQLDYSVFVAGLRQLMAGLNAPWREQFREGHPAVDRSSHVRRRKKRKTRE